MRMEEMNEKGSAGRRNVEEQEDRWRRRKVREKEKVKRSRQEEWGKKWKDEGRVRKENGG